MLGWAESPYGAVALFMLAVAESVFFPIPPDVLLIALALGRRRKALYFGLLWQCRFTLWGDDWIRSWSLRVVDH